MAGRLLQALALVLLSGCGGRQVRSTLTDWTPRATMCARYFQEWAQGDERLLITFGRGGTSDTTGIYQLSPDGRFAPGPAQAVHLKVPLTRVALRSTTHAPFISALGRAGAVVGCAHADLLEDPVWAALRETGRLKEIATADGLDRERLAMLRPQALFSYAFGKTTVDRAVAGPPTVEIGEYLEALPLGRAEWLRVFGLFLGRERMADSLFQAIAARYTEACGAVPVEMPRPIVFFGSSWKGTWSVPSGDSYMARLIDDAGGHYLFADRNSKGNIDIDLETVLVKGAQADYWGRILAQDRPVTAGDVAGNDTRIMALPAFMRHHCFYGNSEESDLFGRAVLEPDIVLHDLIGILHPALAKRHGPVYFRPVQQ
jgi:iron complex transport system substrate-binding protein